jgi:uncharacterized cysteine cluster protein YcgN (CxxCxxCC family)
MPEKNFWEYKSLEEMAPAEWEALCDGCGRCCLHKLEDKESGDVSYTSVACRLLDIHHCRCTAYADRTRLVPDCMTLTPKIVSECYWLPSTCAYRRILEGAPLLWWHPLISGSSKTVHDAGISLRNKAVSETYVNAENLEPYVISDDI